MEKSSKNKSKKRKINNRVWIILILLAAFFIWIVIPKGDSETSKVNNAPATSETDNSFTATPDITETIETTEGRVSPPTTAWAPALASKNAITVSGTPISAISILLYDETENEILFAQNADIPAYPASLTKLLTASVALKYADPDTYFMVGTEIDKIDKYASRAYLAKGQEYKLCDLLAALLLPSGSDAAYCIAANVGRIAGGQELTDDQAIAKFMELMNQALTEIGATSTHFVNPDGMFDPNHISSAYDLLKIARFAQSFPLISDIISRDKMVINSKSGKSTTYENTNLLLKKNSEYYTNYVTGMKTGSLNEAGYCLAASAQKDGRKLIAIILSSSTTTSRFAEARQLFEAAFAAAN